ncbi:MarR family transcriptional regulator [Saccharopolyspora rhizosphaerae]|uniref:MarR family transcriptional regulator n=1 Tax=Saccharopolyspora rhizosphaerae TaxID=2492662 RepID=A0A426K0B9_9PSEU|nr:MarR family transcriptional regulator [Saccharopolyspora rhizosphaerae]RRO18732.1 MarR family transcriptional regulator [Saccharopolyspora rhizosphaerae]
MSDAGEVDNQGGSDQSGGAPAATGDVALGELLRALNVELDRFSVLFGNAHGLYRTDLNAIVAILDAANRGDPMTPSRLAAALDLSASATTTLLERLESLGHLTREHSKTDRRRVDLDIHDTARQIGNEFHQPLMRELGQVWERFSEDQRRTISEFLTATIEATARARETIEPR